MRIKCWQSFLWENLTIVWSDFVSQWHASILSSSMSKPIILKTLHMVPSKSFESTDLDMPITSMHSCHKYWAFAQHCLPVFSSSFKRLLFTVFTISTPDSSLLKLLFKSFISAIKESIVGFVLSCNFKNRSIYWVLFKAFKVSSVYTPVMLSKKKCYPSQVK